MGMIFKRGLNDSSGFARRHQSSCTSDERNNRYSRRDDLKVAMLIAIVSQRHLSMCYGASTTVHYFELDIAVNRRVQSVRRSCAVDCHSRRPVSHLSTVSCTVLSANIELLQIDIFLNLIEGITSAFRGSPCQSQNFSR